MLSSTLPRLRCPACREGLRVVAATSGATPSETEILSGELRCLRCEGNYPILAGVAVLVEDVREYLLNHVQGISGLVSDGDIPASYREDYLEAKERIELEHIPEDLESERVVSLYLANHYLNAGMAPPDSAWWKSLSGTSSPLIDSLIREHWDHGPLARITQWVSELNQEHPIGAAIELGCGVAGLARRLAPHTRSYLGIDSSFASIALGRHLALGAPYARAISVPNDLLAGPVARTVHVETPPAPNGDVDLIVGDLDAPPVAMEEFDLALALNTIDMLPEPVRLPGLQAALLKSGGIAIQSCPYIWHEAVASELRDLLPQGVRDSATAVEWIYEQAGFKIGRKIDHLPWLFFKHARQLEIYSVHAFCAAKG